MAKTKKPKKKECTHEVETDIKVTPKRDPVSCPQGYSWDGSKCVKDVG